MPKKTLYTRQSSFLSLRGIENARKVIGLYICSHNAFSYVRELKHFQVKLVSIHPRLLSGRSGDLRIKGILLYKFLKCFRQNKKAALWHFSKDIGEEWLSIDTTATNRI
jgi:hypothetical protein